MNSKEKANELVRIFSICGCGKENAKICVKEIMKDLKESLDVTKDLHPQAEGLITGSLYFWQSVKNELELIS